MVSPAPHPTAAKPRPRPSPLTIGNILVVVDPTARSPSIDKAVRLAKRNGAHLELFVCDTEPECPESLRSALSVWDYRRHVRTRRLHLLEALAEPLRSAGLTVHTSATWCNSLARGIVDVARHVFADWVVKNRDDTRGTEHLLSESDATLLKQLPGSLLLVNATSWPASPKIDVLLGSDEALTDELLIDRAAALAEHLDGELDLSNHHRPSVVVMATPSKPRWTNTAAVHSLNRLRDCDLLLIKPPSQSHPFG